MLLPKWSKDSKNKVKMKINKSYRTANKNTRVEQH